MKYFIIICTCLWYACGVRAEILELRTVEVAVDESLSIPVSKVARYFAQQYGVSISLIPIDNNEEYSLISESATADILITSRKDWIEKLKQQGLIDIYSHILLASNALEIVAAKRWEFSIDTSPPMSIQPEPKTIDNFALLLPVPGKSSYTKEAEQVIRKLGAWRRLEDRIIMSDRPHIMARVLEERPAIGVMTRSQRILYPNLEKVAVIPTEFYTPIDYYAVVLAGDSMNDARVFLTYLATEDVQKRFKNAGLHPSQ